MVFSPGEKVKQQIWDEYNLLDPDMRSGDVVLNLDVAAGSEEFYTVVAGDSLSKIASKYKGVTWQKIFEANRDQIKNPDLIPSGPETPYPDGINHGVCPCVRFVFRMARVVSVLNKGATDHSAAAQ